MHLSSKIFVTAILLAAAPLPAWSDDAPAPAASAPAATTAPDTATTPAPANASQPADTAATPDASPAAADTATTPAPEAATAAPPAGVAPTLALPKLPDGVKQDFLTDLLAPGPLGDMGIGDPKAPVVVIEYASMTCPHCRAFHSDSYPYLKSKYIDTGKVYFIFREFPLEDMALGASMLARCAPADKFFPVINVLFDMQENWAESSDPTSAVLGYLQPLGFTTDSMTTCFNNQKVLDGINAVHSKAEKKFAVHGTPTFFFNGKREVGELDHNEIDAILAPML